MIDLAGTGKGSMDKGGCVSATPKETETESKETGTESRNPEYVYKNVGERN